MKLKMSGNEDHHRQGRRFAARGNGHDERDPRDVEIERLRQRVRKLKINPFDRFEDLEYPFFEGDGSYYDECEDYEGPPVFDDDEFEDEPEPTYDTEDEEEATEVLYPDQGDILVSYRLLNVVPSDQSTTPASSSLPSHTDLPVRLQFGLFSGPTFIPSPVPAIQIGSIQMPLHFQPPVGSSMGHINPSQPLFQFGQLRYTSPVSQGILPMPTQPISLVQPRFIPSDSRLLSSERLKILRVGKLDSKSIKVRGRVIMTKWNLMQGIQI